MIWKSVRGWKFQKLKFLKVLKNYINGGSLLHKMVESKEYWLKIRFAPSEKDSREVDDSVMVALNSKPHAILCQIFKRLNRTLKINGFQKSRSKTGKKRNKDS